MTGIVLPNRALSPEEQRGFRMACACFATWGYQLVGQPRLAGAKPTEEMRQRFAAHGRFLMATAAALDRQIGRAVPPEAIAEIIGHPARKD